MRPGRLLLDEMISPVVAEHLNARGHDVCAVAADPDLRGRTDDEILTHAVRESRTLASQDVSDFMRLVRERRSSGDAHPGLVLLPTSQFPHRRSFIGAVVEALNAAAAADRIAGPGSVQFLSNDLHES